MLKHYIKAALRILLRDKIYVFVTVLGLAFGLALGMFSMAYLVRELSWENCHENRDRIYRVEMQYHHMDTVWTSARVMAPLGDELAKSIPAVNQVAVFRHRRTVTIKMDDKTYQAGRLIFARPGFFDVFTVPLLSGDPRICLQDPGTILVTDTIARTYFPGRDPIGQTITINNDEEYRITGILKNIPKETQLYCDFIASYSTLKSMGADPGSWTKGHSDLTYLLMRDDIDRETIENNINAVFDRFVSDDISRRYTFSLKPLKEVYYDTYFSGNRGELLPGWEPDMVIFIVAIGLFILLQSIVNFISLSTARASDRMKEVGVRKTFGANQPRLVLQFLGESFALTAIAMALGLFIFELIAAGYAALGLAAFEKTYELANLYAESGTVMLIIALMISVGLLAGIYPALYLSRLRPISILRESHSGTPSRAFMRKTLAVFQFTLAIFFINVTVGLYHQQTYITGFDRGFDQTDMMVLRFSEDDRGIRDCAIAEHEILAQNDVVDASRIGQALGSRIRSTQLYTDPERDKMNLKYAKEHYVDFNFLSFYGLELLEGRGFSVDIPEDISHGIIINESFKNDLELGNPVGYRLYTDSSEYEIVGVVKDFQGTALDWSYRPNAILVLNPENTRTLCIKLNSHDISQSVAGIRNTWQQVFPDQPFEYSFLDDDIRAQYQEMDNLVPMFASLSAISIIIACLGVFGLIRYTVEKKAKEMAIRRILGASTAAIFKCLTMDFFKLIALANIIACPLGLLVVIPYIQQYPFQTSLGFGTYIFGGILTISISLALSGFHIVKAAVSNPVHELKYE